MSTWFYKHLGDGMMADEPAEQIRAACDAQLKANDAPDDFAVFTRAESEGRLHCEVVAYFSPAAAEIARSFEANPCVKPVRTGLGLLAGKPGCWAVLFNEREP